MLLRFLPHSGPHGLHSTCPVTVRCITAARQRAREANVEDQKSELKRIGRAISCAMRQHGKWHSLRAVNHAVESEFCSGEMHVSSLRPSAASSGPDSERSSHVQEFAPSMP